jgi:hypothetical protein
MPLTPLLIIDERDLMLDPITTTAFAMASNITPGCSPLKLGTKIASYSLRVL